jgi:alpha-tubulin suppressor-like RCC1 family protein
MDRKAAGLLRCFVGVLAVAAASCGGEQHSGAAGGGDLVTRTSAVVRGASTVTLCNLPRATRQTTVRLCGFTTPGADGSAIASVWFSVDGGAPLFVVPDSGGFVDTSTVLTEGTHAIRLSARSAAGNLTFEEKAVTVDLTPPVLQVLSPTSADVMTRTVVNVTSSVSDASAVRVQTQWMQASTVDSGVGTVTHTVDLVNRGDTTLLVRATDAAGNTSEARVTVFFCPASDATCFASAHWAPVIVRTDPSTNGVPADGSLTLRVVASDPQSSPLTFSWTSSAGTLGAPASDTTLSEVAWTPPACAPAGTTPSVTATVTNALGASASHTFTVTGVPTCASPGGSALAGGFFHSASLKQDGTVWAWGYNSDGELGDGTTTSRSSPAQVPGLSGGTAIAAGFWHTVVLRQDGTVWTWGYNLYGQLGDGTTTSRSSPVQVPGLHSVTAIAANHHQTMALRQDGTVWAWGHNGAGQLGDGTTTSRTSPVQVPGLTHVIALAVGPLYTVALRQDGTVWAWGHNGAGQLGDGTTTSRSSPVQVPGLSGVAAVDTGYSHTMVLRQDGTVWAWGDNGYGQLGDGTTTGRSSPAQVPGLSGVTSIATTYHQALALRQDGTVWAWGYNGYGQLGDGTTTSHSSPVQVPGLSGVAAIATAHAHSMVLRQDGTLWAWGYNGYGQLGDGTTADRFSPVRVPLF